MSTDRTTDAGLNQGTTDKDEPQDYRGILGYTPAKIGVGPAFEWSPFRPKPYPIIDSYEVAKAIEKTNATSLHRKDKK